jgi:hypothetical protein
LNKLCNAKKHCALVPLQINKGAIFLYWRCHRT